MQSGVAAKGGQGGDRCLRRQQRPRSHRWPRCRLRQASALRHRPGPHPHRPGHPRRPRRRGPKRFRPPAPLHHRRRRPICQARRQGQPHRRSRLQGHSGALSALADRRRRAGAKGLRTRPDRPRPAPRRPCRHPRSRPQARRLRQHPPRPDRPDPRPVEERRQRLLQARQAREPPGPLRHPARRHRPPGPPPHPRHLAPWRERNGRRALRRAADPLHRGRRLPSPPGPRRRSPPRCRRPLPCRIRRRLETGRIHRPLTMDTDLHLTLDFADFDPTAFHAAEARSAHRQRQAVAHRTRSRRQARRAASEARLAEILPAVIEDGDAWHVLSQGDIDALSYLAHLLKATPMDYVALSTWCMAMADVEQLRTWLAEGPIGRLDAYVGEIFPSQYPAEDEALRAAVRLSAGRVAVYRNHAKLFLCRAGQRAWVIESSANINTNPRAENTVITADTGLFLHHKAHLDGIRSFNRDFDAWQPACPPSPTSRPNATSCAPSTPKMNSRPPSPRPAPTPSCRPPPWPCGGCCSPPWRACPRAWPRPWPASVTRPAPTTSCRMPLTTSSPPSATRWRPRARRCRWSASASAAAPSRAICSPSASGPTATAGCVPAPTPRGAGAPRSPPTCARSWTAFPSTVRCARWCSSSPPASAARRPFTTGSATSCTTSPTKTCWWWCPPWSCATAPSTPAWPRCSTSPKPSPAWSPPPPATAPTAATSSNTARAPASSRPAPTAPIPCAPTTCPM